MRLVQNCEVGTCHGLSVARPVPEHYFSNHFQCSLPEAIKFAISILYQLYALNRILLKGGMQSSLNKGGQDSRKLDRKKKHKFYGDIVNGILLAAATPFFACKMYNERGTNSLANIDAFIMVSATGISAIFALMAWRFDNLTCSRLSFLGNCFAGSYMGTYHQ